MKKILAVILSVFLIVGWTCNVFAAKAEITFQGIAWGSSMEEVKTLLNDLYGEYESQESQGSGSYLLGQDGKYASDWAIYEASTVTLLIKPKDIELLGYPLANILFVFAQDGDKTQLITIALRPQAPDLSGASFDKMVGVFVDDCISQYGKPKKNSSSQFILLGGENTAIYMYKDTDYFIWYGKTDAIPLLESIQSK